MNLPYRKRKSGFTLISVVTTGALVATTMVFMFIAGKSVQDGSRATLMRRESSNILNKTVRDFQQGNTPAASSTGVFSNGFGYILEVVEVDGDATTSTRLRRATVNIGWEIEKAIPGTLAACSYKSTAVAVRLK